MSTGLWKIRIRGGGRLETSRKSIVPKTISRQNQPRSKRKQPGEPVCFTLTNSPCSTCMQHCQGLENYSAFGMSFKIKAPKYFGAFIYLFERAGFYDPLPGPLS